MNSKVNEKYYTGCWKSNILTCIVFMTDLSCSYSRITSHSSAGLIANLNLHTDHRRLLRTLLVYTNCGFVGSVNPIYPWFQQHSWRLVNPRTMKRYIFSLLTLCLKNDVAISNSILSWFWKKTCNLASTSTTRLFSINACYFYWIQLLINVCYFYWTTLLINVC